MKIVTGADFCRVIRRHGWVHLRSKGSHQTWEKQGCANITVPVHAGKDLKPGLLKQLLRQTGLSESDM